MLQVSLSIINSLKPGNRRTVCVTLQEGETSEQCLEEEWHKLLLVLVFIKWLEIIVAVVDVIKILEQILLIQWHWWFSGSGCLIEQKFGTNFLKWQSYKWSSYKTNLEIHYQVESWLAGWWCFKFKVSCCRLEWLCGSSSMANLTITYITNTELFNPVY